MRQETRGSEDHARLHEVVTSDTFMTMKANGKAEGKQTDIREVSAAEFKAKCLSLFDEVESSRRSFVITKRGRPVARVVPLPREPTSSLRGSLLHEEDLLAPVDVAWEAPGDRA